MTQQLEWFVGNLALPSVGNLCRGLRCCEGSWIALSQALEKDCCYNLNQSCVLTTYTRILLCNHFLHSNFCAVENIFALHN